MRIMQHNPCASYIRLAVVVTIAVVAVFCARYVLGQEAQFHRPTAASAPAESPSATVATPRFMPNLVEGYSVPREQLQRLADALKAEFPPERGAKIATNERGSTILVLGNAELQSQISARLQELQASPPALDNVTGPELNSGQAQTPSREEAPIQRELRLEHLQAKAFEARLERLWGRPLPLVTENDGDLATLTISAESGRVTIHIDRKSGRLLLTGPEKAVSAWAQVATAFDAPQTDPRRQTAVVPLRWSDRNKVETALTAVRSAGSLRWGGDLAAAIFQPQPPVDPPIAEEDEANIDGEPVPADEQPPSVPEPQRPVAPRAEGGDPGVIGPVQIEFLEGLDVIVIRGNKRDVERVTKIIEDIERLSAETEPSVQVIELRYANGEAVAPIVTDVYTQFFAPRHGRVSITPLVKPNALLLVGRPEAVASVAQLIRKLDDPVVPQTQFKVIQLQHLAAIEAEQTLNQFFQERGGLGTRVRVICDYRTNAILVQGGPRDIAEIEQIVARLDVSESKAVQEVRVFRLRNALAEDLAPVIQEAIRGDASRPGTGVPGSGGNQAPPTAPTGGQRGALLQPKALMLTLTTIDNEGGRILKSGILSDVLITADVRANALVVRGPGNAMELIGALIGQLDQLPTDAEIKVFTIVNGDAAALTETLAELFGQQQQQGALGVAAGAGAGDSTLVPLRFSVDLRTNSIVASGSAADLGVVEAILLRLDEGDIRDRITVVYRLKNSPALDVATAINEFLRSEREVQTLTQGQGTPFEQIEREVVVVPEPVSNSLIVSASPRYFEEIKKVVERLDERPPMVLIQVLIAEVSLDDVNELGVELGIQDSLLFDRSSIIDDILVPGFNFNNQPLGNSALPGSLATRENLAGQALSNFNLQRTNNELGYGGLVLSASSESLSILIRALQDERSLQILSRPQVMTLDNQPAFVQVGQRVPRITSSNIVNNAIINNTVLENVGILLGVTPRIAPDGQVVMEIDAEKSEVGSEADGIPISISENGQVIRSPRIDIITAQTTVSARSGQTVILGGLITKSNSTVTRRVPYLSDVPVVGNLFRYDRVDERRRELLFIMTPYIVRGDADVEFTKHMESSRMSWCLADVVCVHGDVGLSSAFENPQMGACDCGPMTIYPDSMPAGIESIQTPTPGMPTPASELYMPTEPEPVPEGEPRQFSWQFWKRRTPEASTRQVEPATYQIPVPQPTRGWRR